MSHIFDMHLNKFHLCFVIMNHKYTCSTKIHLVKVCRMSDIDKIRVKSPYALHICAGKGTIIQGIIFLKYLVIFKIEILRY